MKKKELLLDEAFALRPDRFRLLEIGIKRVKWNIPQVLLEIGCSIGDAAAHMANNKGHNITAVDYSFDCIERAKILHENEMKQGNLKFYCEDASELSFDNNSFDGIYSEAAFSPIIKKKEVLQECYRVLKHGGKYLINDFVIQSKVEETQRENVGYIPCFAGVGTIDEYRERFENAGFHILEIHEDYSELIRISAWLGKVYGITAAEVGGYLSSYYRSNVQENCGDCKTKKDDFFSRAKLTYYQIILEKR